MLVIDHLYTFILCKHFVFEFEQYALDEIFSVAITWFLCERDRFIHLVDSGASINDGVLAREVLGIHMEYLLSVVIGFLSKVLKRLLRLRGFSEVVETGADDHVAEEGIETLLVDATEDKHRQFCVIVAALETEVVPLFLGVPGGFVSVHVNP